MIVGFKGLPNKGKTLSMVAVMLELLRHHGYSGWECTGNVDVKVPGYSFVSSESLKSWIREMITKGLRHRVVLIDEIDRVFPHRLWADKRQVLDLTGIWQDEKLFNFILWTAHMGDPVDKIVREATQISVIPDYQRDLDRVVLGVVNVYDLETHEEVIEPASAIFPFYDRWAMVS